MQKRDSLQTIIETLSEQLLDRAPGVLAELRRLDVAGPGTGNYWLLATDCGFDAGPDDKWMRIVRLMATLTPRGERNEEYKVHNSAQPLGRALCDGGSNDWNADESHPPDAEPRPFYSQSRLARLLSMNAGQRLDALDRAVLMLARSRDVTLGIDCVELALLVLTPDNPKHLRNLARDYYRRLDAARPGKPSSPKTSSEKAA